MAFFFILNNISESIDQVPALLTLLCKGCTLFKLDMILYTLASSANSFSNTSITSGKSFMNTKNRTGPRTLPWGMPLVTFLQSDFEPFIVTLF